MISTNATSTTSITSFTAKAFKKPKARKLSTFVLHRLLLDDRLVIVAADQLFPNDPEGIKLPPSAILKSTTASCWLEAKRKFRFPLTDFQDYLLAKRFQQAA